VVRVLEPELGPAEEAAFRRCAEIVRDGIARSVAAADPAASSQ
jgi:hypothetical protein